MKSTDHNINNPLKIIDIDLLNSDNYIKPPDAISTHMPIYSITQEEYDAMGMHEPTNLYYISNSTDGRMYLGDALIIPEVMKSRYFMTVNERGQYVIYENQNHIAAYTGTQKLVSVCVYNDPQVAINELSKFNRVGSHNIINQKIYDIFNNYITLNLSTHDCIISILSAFNYHNDPRLQHIIEFATVHNVKNYQKEFPTFYVNQIFSIKEDNPESLFSMYSSLYDLMRGYSFFKDKKYHVDRPNLSNEISKVFNVMTGINLMN